MPGLAEYGVAIFAMGCLTAVVLKHLSFVKNHIRHSTEASEKLTSAIKAMLKYLEKLNGKGD